MTLYDDIYLGLGQVKRIGKFGPFGDAQILFFPELFLQVQQLLRGERRPGFPVGFVFPQIAFKFWRFAVIGIYEKCNHVKYTLIIYIKVLTNNNNRDKGECDD